jgi:hypothetical protein
MRFNVGSRVHYRVYPSGMPATDTAGTVTAIGRHAPKAGRLTYSVLWDDVDPARYAPTPGYMAADLARIACDACNTDAGQPCQPYCIGAAAHNDARGL